MITLNKWYPLVQPTYDARMIAFDKAVEKKLADYKLAVECKKQVIKTQEMEVELYNKRAQQNTIELTNMHTNVTNIRRFAIFI
jgi:hypothetical protein